MDFKVLNFGLAVWCVFSHSYYIQVMVFFNCNKPIFLSLQLSNKLVSSPWWNHRFRLCCFSESFWRLASLEPLCVLSSCVLEMEAREETQMKPLSPFKGSKVSAFCLSILGLFLVMDGTQVSYRNVAQMSSWSVVSWVRFCCLPWNEIGMCEELTG